jgi:hypothetical protein
VSQVVEQFKASLGKQFMEFNLNQQLGAVVHACYPKLHGRLRSEGVQFQSSLAKKGHETPTQEKRWACAAKTK